MAGWSLLTDFDATKRAGVPILRSINIRFRLKQQASERGTILPANSLAYQQFPRLHIGLRSIPSLTRRVMIKSLVYTMGHEQH